MLLLISYTDLLKAQVKDKPSGLFGAAPNDPSDKVYLRKNYHQLSEDLQLLGELAETRKKTLYDNLEVLSSIYQFEGDMIAVEAIAQHDATLLLPELKKIGLTNEAYVGRLVSGFLPLQVLNKAKKLPGLILLRPAYRPILYQGGVKSQGDRAMQSDSLRSQTAFLGEGIKIGVISDSYNHLLGAEEAIIQGELPGALNPFGHTEPVQILIDRLGQGTDEGRAMLEIVHDIAPKASLAFRTTISQCDFVKGIQELANVGCHIIADDLLYPTEPMFQDGVIAQKVDDIEEQGVAYFSSAGNLGFKSYESEYRDAGTPFTLRVAPEILPDKTEDERVINGKNQYQLHDFDPGPGVDVFQKVSLAEFSEFVLYLHWDSPYASACGTCDPQKPEIACLGSESDLDIFVALRDGDLNSILPVPGFGFNSNTGRDPMEILPLRTDSLPAEFYLVIGKWNRARGENPNPTHIKYINFGSDEVEIEYDSQSSTIYGHANAQGAITVGAVRYDQTPAYGVALPALETDFYQADGGSSAGGTPVFFAPNGQRMATVVRQKPEVCGPQGVNTSFFGHTDYEQDGFPNFFGTSASVPHVAALAALALQADTGLIHQPAQLRQFLITNSIDMDDPRSEGFDVGFDFATGFGYVEASRLLKEKPSPPRPAPQVTNFALINAFTDTLVQLIEDGDTLVMSDLGFKSFSIQAMTAPDTVGSVKIDVISSWFSRQIENVFPYSAFGDINGRYNGRLMSFGHYTVKATAYPEAKQQGRPSATKVISFTLVEQIEELTLVDAHLNKDVLTLSQTNQPNPVIDLSEIGNTLNFRAVTGNDENVGSVLFHLSKMNQDSLESSVFFIENTPPFAMAGNNAGNYRPWEPEPGEYRLRATPYSEEEGLGTAGKFLEITFTIVDSSQIQKAEISLYPNPMAEDKLVVDVGPNNNDITYIAIRDQQGNLKYEQRFHSSEGISTLSVDLSALSLTTGLYLLEIRTHGKKSEIRRILKP